MNDPVKSPSPPPPDPWRELRALTDARIGLPRSGASLATPSLLDFRLAHARARDAVAADLDIDKLAAGLAASGLPVVIGGSAAADKRTYLMRPDLGRRLSPETEAALQAYGRAGGYDVAIIVSDGLSARAVENHAVPLLLHLLPLLRSAGLSIAPLTLLRRGRVAIGDEVAQIVGARCAVMLIGERPGLSAPDSLGAYLTWKPGAQTSDADRNCISNIRPAGIAYDAAANRLAHLLGAIFARGQSGVALKDTSDAASRSIGP